MQLSEHFTLDELISSSHHEIDNWPSPEVIERLRVLARDFLEPVRARFGALRVTSGYRCPELNRVVGGVADSAHVYGCAADLQPLTPGITIADIVRWVTLESGLPYDQVIDEGSDRAAWCHLGIVRPGPEVTPRHTALIMRSGKYSPFVG